MISLSIWIGGFHERSIIKEKFQPYIYPMDNMEDNLSFVEKSWRKIRKDYQKE